MHNKYAACLLADWCWWDQLLWYWNWVLYDKTIFGFSVVSRKFSWRHKSIDIHVINLTLKARHQVNTVWDSSLKKEIYIYFYEKKCVYIHTYICFFPKKKKNYILFLFFFSKIKHPRKKAIFSLRSTHQVLKPRLHVYLHEWHSLTLPKSSMEKPCSFLLPLQQVKEYYHGLRSYVKMTQNTKGK